MTIDFVNDQYLQSEMSVSAQQSHMVDSDWIAKYSVRQKSNAYLCVKWNMSYIQHVSAPK